MALALPWAYIRRVHALLTLSLLACLSACAARTAAPASEPAHQRETVSLEGWQTETFPLPPSFAPTLPTGVETLRFSPGWRSPDAGGFWSYAFVMWIDEPSPDAARLEDLLEKYYSGLMNSFAADRGKDISGTPTRVDVVRTAPNRYEASMHLIDAFATFKPIDLRVVIDAIPETDTRTSLSIQVSPQPKEHAIWRSLQAAIADILSRDAASPR